MTQTAHGLDIQGHRGARGLAPENTPPAFAKALTLGVATLELDLGVTSDGVLVVSHNPALNPDITRDSTGAWLAGPSPSIRSLTFRQLQAYDVGRLKPGTAYAARFPHQQGADRVRVPAFEEILKLIERSGNKLVRLNIETKLTPTEPEMAPVPAVFVAAILKALGAHGLLGRAVIQSFDWRTLIETQKQAPEVPTSYLTIQKSWLNNIRSGHPGPSPWTAGFDIDDYHGDIPAMIKAAGGRIWSSHHREVDAGTIRRAHELGLQVKVWTVNKPDRMKELIAMGVDGIITDYPDRLRRVAAELGLPLPAPSPVAP